MIGLHIGVSVGFNYIVDAISGGIWQPEDSPAFTLDDFSGSRTQVNVSAVVGARSGGKVRLFSSSQKRETEYGVLISPEVGSMPCAKNVNPDSSRVRSFSHMSISYNETDIPVDSNYLAGKTDISSIILTGTTEKTNRQNSYVYTFGYDQAAITSSTIMYMSAYCKKVAGSSDWCKIQGRNNTSTSKRVGVWFNLVTGAVYSTYDESGGDVIPEGIIAEEMDNGWWRFGIAYDAYQGTPGSSDLWTEVKPANTAGSENVAVGDAVQVFGMQLTDSSPHPESYAHYELIGRRDGANDPLRGGIGGDDIVVSNSSAPLPVWSGNGASVITMSPAFSYNSEEDYYKTLVARKTAASSTYGYKLVTLDESSGGMTVSLTADQNMSGNPADFLTLGTPLPMVAKQDVKFRIQWSATEDTFNLKSEQSSNIGDVFDAWAIGGGFVEDALQLGYHPDTGYLNGYIKAFDCWIGQDAIDWEVDK